MMFRVILFIVTLLIITGCTTKEISKPNNKSFEQEDMYILMALRAEQLNDYESSSKIFNKLYEKSEKKEYLYRALQNDLTNKKNIRVVNRVDEITKGSLEDFALVRLKVLALIQQKKLNDANKLALSLVEKSGDIEDYLLVSDIYIVQKKFDTAVKYLESAYARDYNEKVLDKMSIILYVNLQRTKEAIAQLETHTMVHGCSVLICKRLIGFYSDENNIDGILSAYLRFYKIEKNDEVAEKITQIYSYKKEFIKLIGFLEDSKSNDELLLQLYTNSRSYKKASDLANELYSKSGDINYLGQSAIFEYESSEDKNNSNMQNQVIKKLKRVLKENETGLYLNYLGYLMIDHSIDVNEGISYVKKALEIEPNSAFYLDSLAWGYYKLGECEKAKIFIEKAMKEESGDDEEVISHSKIINECIKLKKGKTKK